MVHSSYLASVIETTHNIVSHECRLSEHLFIQMFMVLSDFIVILIILAMWVMFISEGLDYQKRGKYQFTCFLFPLSLFYLPSPAAGES